tara:strand:+ start:1716 stop:1880 length:165 start_codon:yes stop_codon:yes gene_type:complete
LTKLKYLLDFKNKEREEKKNANLSIHIKEIYTTLLKSLTNKDINKIKSNNKNNK